MDEPSIGINCLVGKKRTGTSYHNITVEKLRSLGELKLGMHNFGNHYTRLKDPWIKSQKMDKKTDEKKKRIRWVSMQQASASENCGPQQSMLQQAGFYLLLHHHITL